jgi:hypothetical protein
MYANRRLLLSIILFCANSAFAQFLIRIISLLLLFSASTQVHSDLIKHSDQRIHIQYASTLKKAERQQTYVWLQRVTEALLTVYGEWPKDQFNITIQLGSSRNSPVPWGQVTRGNPDTVLLVVNPESDLQAITSDWTAFHELSHLLIPYRGHGDLWFSEGLATYYQNIIQARTGLLSEADLWQKLASGFERGRKQRVHWSGVHYWLTADIKLRQQSQNKKTLDHLLKQLKDCCQHKSMSAAAIAEQLDLLAGVELFKPLFIEYRTSLAMPDYNPVLTSLGVMTGQYNREYDVVLITDAPSADIRRRIYQGDS